MVLADDCDAAMDDREHSRKTLAKMVAIVRQYGRLELSRFFATVNPQGGIGQSHAILLGRVSSSWAAASADRTTATYDG